MAKGKAEIQDADMTVGEHIDELRKYLVRSAVVLVSIAIVLFIFKGIVVDFIFGPMEDNFPTNRFFDWLSTATGTDILRINQHPVEIINTKMAGQFALHIKSSIIGALVLTFPFIIWQLWSFIKPALTLEVIRQCRRIVLQISLWFFVGFAFGYFVIAPLAVNFLTGYVVTEAIENKIEVSSFLSSVLGVSFAAALIFQLPVVVRLLATIGVLKASMMRKYRKIMIVIILIISAVITPPDVFSQILIAIPLYVLFEYGIRITSKIEKQRAAHEQEMIRNGYGE